MFTSYRSMLSYFSLLHSHLLGFVGHPQVVSDSELQATSSKASSATAASSPAKLGALNLEKKTVLETVPGLEKMSFTNFTLRGR